MGLKPEQKDLLSEAYAGTKLAGVYTPPPMSKKHFDELALSSLGLPESKKLNTWSYIARPDQIVPQWDWRYFHIKALRGWGKTRAGIEWAVGRALEVPGAKIAVFGDPWIAEQVMRVLEQRILVGDLESVTYKTSTRRVELDQGSKIYLLRIGQDIRGHEFDAAYVDLDSNPSSRNEQRFFDDLDMAVRRSDSPQIMFTEHSYSYRLPRYIFESGEYVLRDRTN